MALHQRASELQRELTEPLSGTDISVHEGRAIIEVKPSMITKGGVVRELSSDLAAITINIGQADTAARHSVAKPSQLLTVLEDFTPASRLSTLAEIPGKLPGKITRWVKRE